MPPISPVQRAQSSAGIRRSSILEESQRVVTPMANTDIASPLPPIEKHKNEDDELDEQGNHSDKMDDTTRLYFGSDARHDFYKLFKSNLTARHEYGQTRPLTSRTKYLRNCMDNYLIPDPLIIPKRACSSLYFQYYNLGNDYCKAFGESVSIVPNITTINFKGNGINGSGIVNLMEGLCNQKNGILEIDLSDNEIGKEGVEKLSEYLKDKHNCHLTVLSLENCKLGRENTLLLADGIAENKTLTFLNLANNQIEEDSVTSIGVAVSCNPFLQTLDLSYNQIRGYGAASFARSLQINDSLTSLNLAHNGFSNSVNQVAIQSLSSSLAINKTLVHLDISYNTLKPQDILVLATGLNFNHTIRGLHIYGNDGHIDSKVFALPGPPNNPEIDQLSLCWVCQNYQEFRFTFILSETCAVVENKEMIIRLEIDEWRDEKMKFDKTNNAFEIYRMVPPGICRFYFIQDDKEYISDDYWSEISDISALGYVNVIQIPEGNNQLAQSENTLPRQGTGEPVNESISGNLPKAGAAGGKRKKEPEWNVKKSIFMGRRSENDSRNMLDTPEVNAKAFEGDWLKVDFGKLIKEEKKLEAMKEKWCEHYGIIRQVFLYYTGNSSQGNYYEMNLGDFIDLLHDNDIYHPKLMTMGMIEQMWRENVVEELLQKMEEEESAKAAKAVEKAAKSGDKAAEAAARKSMTTGRKSMAGRRKSKMNDGPQIDINKVFINRGKFMELLTRIGMKRFSTKKKPVRPVDAADIIVNEYLVPNSKKCDNNSFRSMTLYSQVMDDVVRIYQPLFKGAYQVLATTKLKGSTKSYLSLDTYMEVLRFCGLLDGNINEGDARFTFLQSKHVVIDESKNERYKVLAYYEFVEAIARLSNYYQIPEKDDPGISPPVPKHIVLTILLQNLSLKLREWSMDMRRVLCIVKP